MVCKCAVKHRYYSAVNALPSQQPTQNVSFVDILLLKMICLILISNPVMTTLFYFVILLRKFLTFTSDFIMKIFLISKIEIITLLEFLILVLVQHRLTHHNRESTLVMS